MQALLDLPRWLIMGALLGAGASVLLAVVFLLGRRFFPDAPPSGPRLSGDARRRTELRQYFRAIDEPFAEDHPLGEHVVEFYLPNRDVAVTFDPRAYYGLGGASTHAVLVEHEMPGMAIGRRLPFETPDLDFTSPNGAFDETAAAFALLGLPANADEGEVRAAYREKVKAVHPDQGGDPEAFKQLKEAYATARERAAS